MWVCRLPVHIGPLGSYEFAEDFRKKRCILRADRVVRPYEIRGIENQRRRGRRLCRPDKCYEFAADSTSCFCRPRLHHILYRRQFHAADVFETGSEFLAGGEIIVQIFQFDKLLKLCEQG